MILTNLSEPTRRLVEALMLTDNYEEGAFRKMMERVGHVRGLRSAVRLVLDARGVLLDEATAKAVDTCTDVAQLETWARRAAHANDARDLFVDTPAPR